MTTKSALKTLAACCFALWTLIFAGSAGASAVVVQGDAVNLRSGADIEVHVNGRKVEFLDQKPFIDPEVQRTYVPLRFVSEALGAGVEWDGAAKAAVVSTAGKTIRMPAGSKAAQVNGENTPLDAPAMLVDGRTMVPLRFVSEVLGAAVDWVAPEGDQPGRVLITATPDPILPGGDHDGSWTLDATESGGRTQLLIKSPIPLEHKVFTLTQPDRLVIDLVGAPAGDSLPGIAFSSDAVRQVRTGWLSDDPPTGRVVCDLADGLGLTRYRIEVGPERRSLHVEVWTVDRVLKDRIIVLDPGHGGSDPGAIGPTGFMEKDFNLPVALETARLLRQEGAEVILTRTTDVRLRATTAEDLEKRSQIANAYQADLFISIHANAGVSRTLEGTSVYYHAHPKNHTHCVKLARALQDSLVRELGRKDLGIFGSNFLVLRNIEMPGALIETAFVSNYEEERLLAQDGFQKKTAAAIVDGIIAYFKGS